ncbi:twin-arginine translocation signal domain-containing protein [Cupriavidus sp. 2SB]|uniref:twin-arginine translocation signal domain-containing protein n=1 Tax=Cupriavidus sp. 2SB TaxID=2502199 RepID=UPI0010F6742C|nr:twin-arginine translocation signal domain-containing protein [Cupriavidus sp. 2SB]
MQTTLISQVRDHRNDTPKNGLSLTRRNLLKGTGVLIGTLTVGSPLALMAPSTVWALELKALSKAEGDALLQMGRVLFPHDKLPDAVYALLAKDLDQAAAADAQVAKQLRDGIAALNQQAGGNFIKADANLRLAAVKALEDQPFFSTVRGKCVTSLYDNEMAFSAFGYPGSAWEKGGYIMRGFQDLKWLPEPPAKASPAPYMG